MTHTKYYPNWRESVVFTSEGPRHQELIVTDTFRAVLVGLEAGQKIPPHPTSTGAYHFLEGSGWMIVDGERLAVEPGATVVVPNGVPRGIEAETRLAFLGTQAQAAMKKTNWGPLKKFGPIIMFGLMIGVMIIGVLVFSGSGGWWPGMLRLMVSSGSGDLGLGIWAAMLLPFVGLLIMLVMMFFFFRRMAGNSGLMSRAMGHGRLLSKLMSHSHDPQSQSEENNMNTVTYNIPSISCRHCKMRIERKVGKLPGVGSVSVDVDAKQAVIKFSPPATEAEIKTQLAEIGYSPESQYLVIHKTTQEEIQLS